MKINYRKLLWPILPIVGVAAVGSGLIYNQITKPERITLNIDGKEREFEVVQTFRPENARIITAGEPEYSPVNADARKAVIEEFPPKYSVVDDVVSDRFPIKDGRVVVEDFVDGIKILKAYDGHIILSPSELDNWSKIDEDPFQLVKYENIEVNRVAGMSNLMSEIYTLAKQEAHQKGLKEALERKVEAFGVGMRGQGQTKIINLSDYGGKGDEKMYLSLGFYWATIAHFKPRSATK